MKTYEKKNKDIILETVTSKKEIKVQDLIYERDRLQTRINEINKILGE